MQSLAARKINVFPVGKGKKPQQTTKQQNPNQQPSTDWDKRAVFRFLRRCKNLGTQYPLNWGEIIFPSQRLFDSDTGSILM